MGRPWDTHGMPVGYSWARDTHVTPVGCSWGACRMPIGYAWDANGLPLEHMGFPLANYEMPTGCQQGAQWATGGIPMGCPWDAHGMPMGCPWDAHGVLMGSCWGAHGLPLKTRGLLIVYPWDTRSWAFDRMPWDAHGLPMGYP